MRRLDLELRSTRLTPSEKEVDDSMQRLDYAERGK